MSAVPSSPPGFEPVRSALFRIQRRLRLNRTLRVAGLCAGALLALALAWRLLTWFDGRLPAASALVILTLILVLVVVLLLLVRVVFAVRPGLEAAAVEADRRAGLKDELLSALYFSREDRRSDWIVAQAERAARSAAALHPERLVPVRLPIGGFAALAVAALVLLALSAAPPLALDRHSAEDATFAPARLQTLREMVAKMPESDAARQLTEALSTLERADATAEERSKAIAQAQEAVDRMGLSAASLRDEMQELAHALGNQPGMEQVAEALAKGDAERAAQLLEQIEERNTAREGGAGAEPVDAGAKDPSQEPALLEATQAAGAQPNSASPESAQAAIDRLNEIARELTASNYVNEAWQSVRGPQLEQYQQPGALTAGRYAEQTQASSNPSPGSGETPMSGGTMFRSAAVAQGDARTEQEGGTRMGDALGESPSDPVLGKSEERLEVQLKQSALQSEGQDEAAGEEKTWYYAESQQQTSTVSRREVQARARFAQAEAGGNGGISIEHRQIVKDYFMNLRESAQ